MNRVLHGPLLAGGACAMLVLAPAVKAQQAAASDQSGTTATQPAAQEGLGEIVVTANKREERLEKVGASITALSGEELAERKITSLQDVADAVPGLTFAPSADNTPIFTLRGIGFNNSSLGVYPAVSVYLDQAPLPFPVLTSHSAYDLQRIEVLKGPQGTLFGENSTGGAINYVAARPTQSFEAGGDISYGRFNKVEVSSYVSGPISDTIRARAAVDAVNSDGWQVSTSRPYDTNGKQSYVAGRFIVDWDTTDAIHFSLNVNGWTDTSQPQASQFILLFPQTPAEVKPQELAFPFSPQKPRAADWSTGPETPRSDRDFFQTALRGDFNLPADLVLTSLTSFDHFVQSQSTDGDGSALLISDLSKDNGKINSFGQEIRVANSAQSQLRWVGGVNYERSDTFEDQGLNYDDDTANTAREDFIHQSEVTVRQTIRNYAGFGNVEFDVAPKFTLVGGARYTDSKNQASTCGFDQGDGHINDFFNLLGTVLGGGAPFTPLSNANPIDERCSALNTKLVPSGSPTYSTLDENNLSWRGGVNFNLDENTLLYVTASRGFKAGSYPVLAAGTASQYSPVTQESVKAYEAGLKAGFWDRKAQMNLAAFYYDYRNKQILGKELDPVFGILDALVNVPKSRIMGIEDEMTVKPFQGMTVQATITYLDSRVQNYSGTDALGNTTNFAGAVLPFTPKWNYAVNADYRLPLGFANGTPFFGATVAGHTAQDTAVGGSNISIPDEPYNRILPGLVHPFTTDAYATVDARIGYEASDGRWRAMLWGKNIFNRYYWTNVVTASDFSARYAGLPSTYGITVSFKVK